MLSYDVIDTWDPSLLNSITCILTVAHTYVYLIVFLEERGSWAKLQASELRQRAKAQRALAASRELGLESLESSSPCILPAEDSWPQRCSMAEQWRRSISQP